MPEVQAVCGCRLRSLCLCCGRPKNSDKPPWPKSGVHLTGQKLHRKTLHCVGSYNPIKKNKKICTNSPQKFREYHVYFETWQWWCDVYTCIYIPDENVPQSVGIIAEVQEKILPLILPESKLIHKTSVLNLCTIQNFSPIAFTSCGFFMHWLVVCNRLSWQ